MQFTKYKFAGSNFGQELENANKVKLLLSSIHSYPFEFMKNVLLNENIVKFENEYALKDYMYKGTFSKFEFLNEPNFIKAIKYTTRKTIRKAI